jgi:hypothetical protein
MWLIVGICTIGIVIVAVLIICFAVTDKDTDGY